MNDYQLKSAPIAAAYGHTLAGAPPMPKRSALEEANDQLQIMIQQADQIDQNLAAFLFRAGGEGCGLNGSAECTRSPQPESMVPRLGSGLAALKSLLNTLGERVGKLNQIA